MRNVVDALRLDEGWNPNLTNPERIVPVNDHGGLALGVLI
jgi:hypothetical protein